ncbi:hypothetical protein [Pseudomonas sp. NPDC007930]|uniref:hypothetical protein n=1 Tax=Pseudomonas sp. NPDC007930 TaxID=3364417 RepID=UPI0036F15ABD
MAKQWAMIALASCLAACSSPAPQAPQPAPAAHAQAPASGCKQANWQAETAPVINKRQGQEALERYDADNPAAAGDCP